VGREMWHGVYRFDGSSVDGNNPGLIERRRMLLSTWHATGFPERGRLIGRKWHSYIFQLYTLITRGTRRQGSGEDYIRRKFMTCTHHQI
jgi:hypothetical protein